MGKVHLSHMYAWRGQDLFLQTHLAYVTEYVHTQYHRHKMLHHCHISTAQNGFDRTVLRYSNAGCWKQSCHPEKAYHSPTQPCLTAYCIWHTMSIHICFRHFTKLCKSVYSVSEVQSIKEGMSQLAWTIYTTVSDWLQHGQHGLQGNHWKFHMYTCQWTSGCGKAAQMQAQATLEKTRGRQLLFHLNIMSEVPV